MASRILRRNADLSNKLDSNLWQEEVSKAHQRVAAPLYEWTYNGTDTTIVLDNLDLVNDETYFIEYCFYNTHGANVTYNYHYNDDTTTGNYYYQYHITLLTTVTANTSNNNVFSFAYPSHEALGFGKMFLGVGSGTYYPRMLVAETRWAAAGTSSNSILHKSYSHGAGLSGVTKFTITPSAGGAAAFGPGSFFRIWKH